MEKGFRSSGGGGQQQEDAALADTAEQVGFLGHFGGHLKKLWEATCGAPFFLGETSRRYIPKVASKQLYYIRQMELVLQD